MMKLRLSSGLAGAALALAVAFAGTACGGASNPRPVPLSRHFEESYIDPLPLPEQQPVLDAKTGYEAARKANAKANADLDASKLQLDVATNDKRAADIDVSSAKSRKAAADTSADQTRINTATGELRGAEKYAEALGQRLTYLRAYREWLQHLQYFTEENMYWEEAKFELAKAELARKNNIQPKGFVYDDYARQQKDRADKVGKRKADAEAKRKAAMDARGKWKALQAEADKLLNKPSNFDDPMANATATGTAIKQDGGTLDLGGGGAASDKMVPDADNTAGTATTTTTPAPSTTPDPTTTP